MKFGVSFIYFYDEMLVSLYNTANPYTPEDLKLNMTVVRNKVQ
jgi:hypothetical protein